LPWIRLKFCDNVPPQAAFTWEVMVLKARARARERGKTMDEDLTRLFRQWLSAFEKTQAATREKDISSTYAALGEIESQIATTPAEGLHGLAVKLGLHHFLNDHADAASQQADSAYADLVRLTGRDPAMEIFARFAREAA